MRPKSLPRTFRICSKSISPRAARPPSRARGADDRRRRPPRLSQTNRLRRHVILPHQLRRSSRLARGGSPPSSASVSRRAPPRPVTAARKMRGKETIDHLYDMLYPKSLVAGKGHSVSVQAGVRARARASRELERRTSCPVHATPARSARARRPPPPARLRPRPISRCQAIPPATKTARSTTSYASRSPRTTCASSISGTSRSERRRASPPAVKREPSTDGRRIGRDERGRRRASSGGTYF